MMKKKAVNSDYEILSIDALLKKAKRSKIPINVKPMLATLVGEPFDDPFWTYEIKWDG